MYKYFLKFSFYLIFLFLFTVTLKAVVPDKSRKVKFIENKSQWEPNVLYRASISAGTLFLEKNAFTYLLMDGEALSSCHHIHQDSSGYHNEILEDRQIKCHAYTMKFLDANPNATYSASFVQPEYYNYFLGDDESKWASNVHLYEEVNYQSVYHGIDINIGSEGFNLKYEFQVQPYADTRQIKLEFIGGNQLSLEQGNLIIKTSVSNIIEQKPYAYQLIHGDTLTVACKYVLKKNIVSFSFPESYRKDLPLVIDPVVVASTYAGASGATTWGHTATYDTDGNIFTGARSFGFGYPVTTGAFQLSFGGGITDAAISKFNPDGSVLLWATYLGGSGDDYSHSLITNNNNELFIYGSTTSVNFPHTASCFQPALGGSYDIFITHLNADGNALIGSSYIGGSQVDGQNQITVNIEGDEFRGEIILDNSGNPCVASFTASANFPTTNGAYDQTFNGQQDGVVFKMSADLTQLIWSTFLGGSGVDAAFGLKLNIVDMVYVTGATRSTDFPASAWVLNPTYQGGSEDGFICIFQPDMSGMISGTFFGTSAQDLCFFIQMDDNNDVYVFGQSLGNMPITPGCFGNPGSPQFIAKLDQTLNSVIWQTSFGSGSQFNRISPTAFLVDLCNNIYAAGWGNTNGFPVTPNAIQSTTDGKDFYLLALNSDATQLKYGTFYGANDPNAFGDHVDGGTSRFDKKGMIYEAVCACASTNPFPTTPNAYQTTPPPYPPQYCDLAVFKIDFQLSGPTAVIGVTPTNTACSPFTPVFTNNSLNALEYLWDFGDGSPVSAQQIPLHTFSTPGTYTVSCIAIDSTSCFISDTAYQTIIVLTPPSVNLGTDTLMCGLPSLTLNAANPGYTYHWSTGATSQQITVTTNGTYWVKVENGSCNATDSIQVEFMVAPELGPDISLCAGLSQQLTTNLNGYQYLWSTGETTPSISVTATNVYYLSVSKQNCTLEDSIRVNFLAHPVVNLGNDTTVCQGETVTLNAENTGSYFHWNTGANTQTLTVYSSGVYSVTVTQSNCTGVDSIQVNVNPVPVVNLLGDRILCDGDTIYLDAGNAGAEYDWSTGETIQQIMITDTGYYAVTVTVGNCSSGDTIHASSLSFHVDLGADTLLCPGESVTLDAGNPGNNYLWNTGQTTQAINIKNNGVYWVRVYKYQCFASDTIHIDVLQPLELPQLLNLCGNEFLRIESNIEADSYLWSTGDDASGIDVYNAGVYTLEAVKKHCIMKDSTLVIGKTGYSVLFFPNTFTPNNDGVNDIFTGIGTDISWFSMEIYNRWGEMIFETNDMYKGWDGKYKGDVVPTGVYCYVVRYATPCSFEQKFKKEGFIFLMK